MEKFYLADEKHVTIKGKEVEEKGVLYFHFTRKSLGGAPDFEFDGRATRQHTKDFPVAFKAFSKEHPDFKSKWSDLELGEVKAATTSPALEAPKKDEAAEEKK